MCKCSIKEKFTHSPDEAQNRLRSHEGSDDVAEGAA